MGEKRIVVGHHKEKTGTREARVKRKGLLGWLGMTKKLKKMFIEHLKMLNTDQHTLIFLK